MAKPQKDGGSIRDPQGQVFHVGHRVLRTVSADAVGILRPFRASALYAELVRDGLLIDWDEVPASPGLPLENGATVLEHPRLPLISYPYEWPFNALKMAALHHLALHRRLLEHGYDLVDAAAYNIQFQGARPVFIDPTSITQHRPGPWRAYRQFCAQFLYPLLIASKSGCDFNSLFRGQIGGLSAELTWKLLPALARMSPAGLLHVGLPMRSAGRAGVAKGPAPRPSISREVFAEMLGGLERIVGKLEPHRQTRSVWNGYAGNEPYAADEIAAKQAFISQWTENWRPTRLLDLGCNSGDYSLLALRHGAGFCIGAEFDAPTADLAFQQAASTNANFTPLVIDLTDPSSDRGWNGEERPSFFKRAAPDMSFALALVHHLAVDGLRMEEIVNWLTRVAPRGIVEFVPPQDPMVQRMLSERGIALPDYGLAAFTALLAHHVRITGECAVAPGGRTLFAFEQQA